MARGETATTGHCHHLSLIIVPIDHGASCVVISSCLVASCSSGTWAFNHGESPGGNGWSVWDTHRRPVFRCWFLAAVFHFCLVLQLQSKAHDANEWSTLHENDKCQGCYSRMRIDEPPSPCVWTVRYHETCFGPFCYDFRVHRITSAIDQNKRIQSAILSRCALIHTCSDARPSTPVPWNWPFPNGPNTFCAMNWQYLRWWNCCNSGLDSLKNRLQIYLQRQFTQLLGLFL